MDDEPMWAADHVVAPTPGSAITIPETANEFAIKGNHLTLVKGNQFDDRTKIDPHKHNHEFLGICDMFKYRDTENEALFSTDSSEKFKLSLNTENESPNRTAWLRMRKCTELSMDSIVSKRQHYQNPSIIGLSEITQESSDAAAVYFPSKNTKSRLSAFERQGLTQARLG
ncbi:hypothetical protein Tco_0963406 [Tanacetum coccineum]